MMPKHGHVGKYIRNTWKVSKSGAGEVQLDRSCENGEILQSQERQEYPNSIKRRKANWIGHTLRRNSLLKHVIETYTEIW